MTASSLRRLSAAFTLFAIGGGIAQAADWSDTAISWRAGSDFREPFNPKDIKKNIFALTHASGYAYGSNYFNVDFLSSDRDDANAQEAYVLYRHTLDLGKVSGKEFKFGPVRGLGLTAGFDWNTKNDHSYDSKKRMLVAGPTLMIDVPGFLNVSLLLLKESNAPYNKFSSTATPRYDYKTHVMLTAAWSIPFGKLPLAFEGFANYIASKGTNEFGGATGPETNFDGQVMLDVGAATGATPNKFKIGLEYQYWRNKFGNPYKGPAGSGAFAKTPMIRAEYHF